MGGGGNRAGGSHENRGSDERIVASQQGEVMAGAGKDLQRACVDGSDGLLEANDMRVCSDVE
jgi:hypothetical protein